MSTTVEGRPVSSPPSIARSTPARIDLRTSAQARRGQFAAEVGGRSARSSSHCRQRAGEGRRTPSRSTILAGRRAGSGGRGSLTTRVTGPGQQRADRGGGARAPSSATSSRIASGEKYMDRGRLAVVTALHLEWIAGDRHRVERIAGVRAHRAHPRRKTATPPEAIVRSSAPSAPPPRRRSPAVSTWWGPVLMTCRPRPASIPARSSPHLSTSGKTGSREQLRHPRSRLLLRRPRSQPPPRRRSELEHLRAVAEGRPQAKLPGPPPSAPAGLAVGVEAVLAGEQAPRAAPTWSPRARALPTRVRRRREGWPERGRSPRPRRLGRRIHDEVEFRGQGAPSNRTRLRRGRGARRLARATSERGADRAVSVATTSQARQLVGDGEGDRAGAGADVEHPIGPQLAQRHFDQQLGLRPRDQDTPVDLELDPAEAAAAEDVSDRLPPQALPDQFLGSGAPRPGAARRLACSPAGPGRSRFASPSSSSASRRGVSTSQRAAPRPSTAAARASSTLGRGRGHLQLAGSAGSAAASRRRCFSSAERASVNSPRAPPRTLSRLCEVSLIRWSVTLPWGKL